MVWVEEEVRTKTPMNTTNQYLSDQERPPIPAALWMTRQKWLAACDLHDTVEAFKGIHEDLTKTPAFVVLGSVEVGCGKMLRVVSVYSVGTACA